MGVTSRNRLSGLITGHGAHQLAVDTLTDTEALGLLVARLGTPRVDAEPAAGLVNRGSVGRPWRRWGPSGVGGRC
ncbi:hypothetical protein ACFQ2K_08070 [Streptomyces sanglieri]|uniref:Uncharacterized protein n=1 Tax=Streptomyces sanglieri TaxID=193460 RepID=A0ABW2WNL9_9ACTN